MARRSKGERFLFAFDLGSTTGWSVWGYGRRGAYRLVASGFEPLSSDGPTRVSRFCELFARLVEAYGVPDTVAYEKVFRHLGTYACHVYGALEGVLQLEVHSRRLGMHPVTVQDVKKVATGKGNAKKELVFAAAQARWGSVITTHDQADACWVGEVALREQLESQ